MSFGYPVLLELAGRRCLVVGERAVVEGKLEGLLSAGADDVLVIVEGSTHTMDGLEGDPRVRVERRRWQPSDLDGAFLVVGWCREPDDRDRLAFEARSRGALVNVIDDVPRCDFAAPAVVRRGELVVAVGTGGASPALARKLREELEARFAPCWAELVDLLRDVRTRVTPMLPELADRSRRWQAVLDVSEAEHLVGEGRCEELRQRLIDRLIGTERRA
ncbi:MAG: bifunctional precorrin-2 dehydrogenase/sirohydrochlorin ferrochelatase [Actinomycetota bacterium]